MSPEDLKSARDKYVEENLRDLIYNMKETKIPKGVWLSTMIMSAPLMASTTYLAALYPMAGNISMVDPY